MGSAIAEILPLAIGVAISPCRSLRSSSCWGLRPRERLAFAVGWLAGLTIAGTRDARVRERKLPAGRRRPVDVGQRPQARPRCAGIDDCSRDDDRSNWPLGGEAAGTVAIFILVGSLSILAPVFIYFALGPKAATMLDELKAWMAVSQRCDR